VTRGSFGAVELGFEPPISNNPAPVSYGDATRRWLAATALMGAAASMLVGGALWTAGGRARRVAAPTFVSRRLPRQTVAEDGRGDPPVRRSRGARPADAAVKIERLADSGSVKPFTRVSARLAEIDPDAPAAPQAETPPPLPPIILNGQAQPKPSTVVTAYAASEPPLTARRPVVEIINITTVARAPAAPEVEKRVVVARQGDTLAAILSALGATAADAEAILAAFAARDGVGHAPLVGGEVVTVLEDRAAPGAPGGPLLKIGVAPSVGDSVVVARADAGGYRPVVAEVAKSPTDAAAPAASDLRAASGATLRESLYSLARSHHVEGAVFAEFLQLCGRDFDLDRPLAATDEARLIYQPNEFEVPELAYVALTAQDRTRRYYRFTAPDDGGTDFYDEQGRSATKFLLRKPVFAGRLGDGFGWRIHPVLRDRRFHEGVDYAAPYGSPIAAAGEGVVERIAEQWGLRQIYPRPPRSRLRDDLRSCRWLSARAQGRRPRASGRDDRLCRLDGPLDRAAPLLRGAHQRP
jgi:murein DD-endopeptidase MepM/ murein hydrolase activator NlpD